MVDGSELSLKIRNVKLGGRCMGIELKIGN